MILGHKISSIDVLVLCLAYLANADIVTINFFVVFNFNFV